MTKATDFSGLGKLVPGFDFLQSLTQGASGGAAKMPSMASWVAPTLNVEDLEKRISELKTVHFWLDQNTKALAATIQALEVQKMTLATLKGMNLSIGELANAFKLPEVDASAQVAAKSAVKTESASTLKPKTSVKSKTVGSASEPATGVVDPLQWWNALGAQFQTIAANAAKEGVLISAETKSQKKGSRPAPGSKRAHKKEGS